MSSDSLLSLARAIRTTKNIPKAKQCLNLLFDAYQASPDPKLLVAFVDIIFATEDTDFNASEVLDWVEKEFADTLVMEKAYSRRLLDSIEQIVKTLFAAPSSAEVIFRFLDTTLSIIRNSFDSDQQGHSIQILRSLQVIFSNSRAESPHPFLNDILEKFIALTDSLLETCFPLTLVKTNVLTHLLICTSQLILLTPATSQSDEILLHRLLPCFHKITSLVYTTQGYITFSQPWLYFHVAVAEAIYSCLLLTKNLNVWTTYLLKLQHIWLLSLQLYTKQHLNSLSTSRSARGFPRSTGGRVLSSRLSTVSSIDSSTSSMNVARDTVAAEGASNQALSGVVDDFGTNAERLNNFRVASEFSYSEPLILRLLSLCVPILSLFVTSDTANSSEATYHIGLDMSKISEEATSDNAEKSPTYEKGHRPKRTTSSVASFQNLHSRKQSLFSLGPSTTATDGAAFLSLINANASTLLESAYTGATGVTTGGVSLASSRDMDMEGISPFRRRIRSYSVHYDPDEEETFRIMPEEEAADMYNTLSELATSRAGVGISEHDLVGIEVEREIFMEGATLLLLNALLEVAQRRSEASSQGSDASINGICEVTRLARAMTTNRRHSSQESAGEASKEPSWSFSDATGIIPEHAHLTFLTNDFQQPNLHTTNLSTLLLELGSCVSIDIIPLDGTVNSLNKYRSLSFQSFAIHVLTFFGYLEQNRIFQQSPPFQGIPTVASVQDNLTTPGHSARLSMSEGIDLQEPGDSSTIPRISDILFHKLQALSYNLNNSVFFRHIPDEQIIRTRLYSTLKTIMEVDGAKGHRMRQRKPFRRGMSSLSSTESKFLLFPVAVAVANSLQCPQLLRLCGQHAISIMDLLELSKNLNSLPSLLAIQTSVRALPQQDKRFLSKLCVFPEHPKLLQQVPSMLMESDSKQRDTYLLRQLLKSVSEFSNSCDLPILQSLSEVLASTTLEASMEERIIGKLIGLLEKGMQNMAQESLPECWLRLCLYEDRRISISHSIRDILSSATGEVDLGNSRDAHKENYGFTAASEKSLGAIEEREEVFTESMERFGAMSGSNVHISHALASMRDITMLSSKISLSLLLADVIVQALRRINSALVDLRMGLTRKYVQLVFLTQFEQMYERLAGLVPTTPSGMQSGPTRFFASNSSHGSAASISLEDAHGKLSQELAEPVVTPASATHASSTSGRKTASLVAGSVHEGSTSQCTETYVSIDHNRGAPTSVAPLESMVKVHRYIRSCIHKYQLEVSEDLHSIQVLERRKLLLRNRIFHVWSQLSKHTPKLTPCKEVGCTIGSIRREQIGKVSRRTFDAGSSAVEEEKDRLERSERGWRFRFPYPLGSTPTPDTTEASSKARVTPRVTPRRDRVSPQFPGVEMEDFVVTPTAYTPEYESGHSMAAGSSIRSSLQGEALASSSMDASEMLRGQSVEMSPYCCQHVTISGSVFFQKTLLHCLASALQDTSVAGTPKFVLDGWIQDMQHYFSDLVSLKQQQGPIHSDQKSPLRSADTEKTELEFSDVGRVGAPQFSGIHVTMELLESAAKFTLQTLVSLGKPLISTEYASFTPLSVAPPLFIGANIFRGLDDLCNLYFGYGAHMLPQYVEAVSTICRCFPQVGTSELFRHISVRGVRNAASNGRELTFSTFLPLFPELLDAPLFLATGQPTEVEKAGGVGKEPQDSMGREKTDRGMLRLDEWEKAQYERRKQEKQELPYHKRLSSYHSQSPSPSELASALARTSGLSFTKHPSSDGEESLHEMEAHSSEGGSAEEAGIPPAETLGVSATSTARGAFRRQQLEGTEPTRRSTRGADKTKWRFRERVRRSTVAAHPPKYTDRRGYTGIHGEFNGGEGKEGTSDVSGATSTDKTSSAQYYVDKPGANEGVKGEKYSGRSDDTTLRPLLSTGHGRVGSELTATTMVFQSHRDPLVLHIPLSTDNADLLVDTKSILVSSLELQNSYIESKDMQNIELLYATQSLLNYVAVSCARMGRKMKQLGAARDIVPINELEWIDEFLQTVNPALPLDDSSSSLLFGRPYGIRPRKANKLEYPLVWRSDVKFLLDATSKAFSQPDLSRNLGLDVSATAANLPHISTEQVRGETSSAATQAHAKGIPIPAKIQQRQQKFRQDYISATLGTGATTTPYTVAAASPSVARTESMGAATGKAGRTTLFGRFSDATPTGIKSVEEVSWYERLYDSLLEIRSTLVKEMMTGVVHITAENSAAILTLYCVLSAETRKATLPGRVFNAMTIHYDGKFSMPECIGMDRKVDATATFRSDIRTSQLPQNVSFSSSVDSIAWNNSLFPLLQCVDRIPNTIIFAHGTKRTTVPLASLFETLSSELERMDSSKSHPLRKSNPHAPSAELWNRYNFQPVPRTVGTSEIHHDSRSILLTLPYSILTGQTCSEPTFRHSGTSIIEESVISLLQYSMSRHAPVRLAMFESLHQLIDAQPSLLSSPRICACLSQVVDTAYAHTLSALQSVVRKGRRVSHTMANSPRGIGSAQLTPKALSGRLLGCHAAYYSYLVQNSGEYGNARNGAGFKDKEEFIWRQAQPLWEDFFKDKVAGTTELFAVLLDLVLLYQFFVSSALNLKKTQAISSLLPYLYFVEKPVYEQPLSLLLSVLCSSGFDMSEQNAYRPTFLLSSFSARFAQAKHFQIFPKLFLNGKSIYLAALEMTEMLLISPFSIPVQNFLSFTCPYDPSSAQSLEPYMPMPVSEDDNNRGGGDAQALDAKPLVASQMYGSVIEILPAPVTERERDNEVEQVQRQISRVSSRKNPGLKGLNKNVLKSNASMRLVFTHEDVINVVEDYLLLSQLLYSAGHNDVSLLFPMSSWKTISSSITPVPIYIECARESPLAPFMAAPQTTTAVPYSCPPDAILCSVSQDSSAKELSLDDAAFAYRVKVFVYVVREMSTNKVQRLIESPFMRSISSITDEFSSDKSTPDISSRVTASSTQPAEATTAKETASSQLHRTTQQGKRREIMQKRSSLSLSLAEQDICPYHQQLFTCRPSLTTEPKNQNPAPAVPFPQQPLTVSLLDTDNGQCACPMSLTQLLDKVSREKLWTRPNAVLLPTSVPTLFSQQSVIGESVLASGQYHGIEVSIGDPNQISDPSHLQQPMSKANALRSLQRESKNPHRTWRKYLRLSDEDKSGATGNESGNGRWAYNFLHSKLDKYMHASVFDRAVTTAPSALLFVLMDRLTQFSTWHLAQSVAQNSPHSVQSPSESRSNSARDADTAGVAGDVKPTIAVDSTPYEIRNIMKDFVALIMGFSEALIWRVRVNIGLPVSTANVALVEKMEMILLLFPTMSDLAVLLSFPVVIAHLLSDPGIFLASVYERLNFNALRPYMDVSLSISTQDSKIGPFPVGAQEPSSSGLESMYQESFASYERVSRAGSQASSLTEQGVANGAGKWEESHELGTRREQWDSLLTEILDIIEDTISEHEENLLQLQKDTLQKGCQLVFEVFVETPLCVYQDPRFMSKIVLASTEKAGEVELVNTVLSEDGFGDSIQPISMAMCLSWFSAMLETNDIVLEQLLLGVEASWIASISKGYGVYNSRFSRIKIAYKSTNKAVENRLIAIEPASNVFGSDLDVYLESNISPLLRVASHKDKPKMFMPSILPEERTYYTNDTNYLETDETSAFDFTTNEKLLLSWLESILDRCRTEKSCFSVKKIFQIVKLLHLHTGTMSLSPITFGFRVRLVSLYLETEKLLTQISTHVHPSSHVTSVKVHIQAGPSGSGMSTGTGLQIHEDSEPSVAATTKDIYNKQKSTRFTVAEAALGSGTPALLHWAIPLIYWFQLRQSRYESFTSRESLQSDWPYFLKIVQHVYGFLVDNVACFLRKCPHTGNDPEIMNRYLLLSLLLAHEGERMSSWRDPCSLPGEALMFGNQTGLESWSKCFSVISELTRLEAIEILEADSSIDSGQTIARKQRLLTTILRIKDEAQNQYSYNNGMNFLDRVYQSRLPNFFTSLREIGIPLIPWALSVPLDIAAASGSLDAQYLRQIEVPQPVQLPPVSAAPGLFGGIPHFQPDDYVQQSLMPHELCWKMLVSHAWFLSPEVAFQCTQRFHSVLIGLLTFCELAEMYPEVGKWRMSAFVHPLVLEYKKRQHRIKQNLSISNLGPHMRNRSQEMAPQSTVLATQVLPQQHAATGPTWTTHSGASGMDINEMEQRSITGTTSTPNPAVQAMYIFPASVTSLVEAFFEPSVFQPFSSSPLTLSHHVSLARPLPLAAVLHLLSRNSHLSRMRENATPVSTVSNVQIPFYSRGGTHDHIPLIPVPDVVEYEALHPLLGSTSETYFSSPINANLSLFTLSILRPDSLKLLLPQLVQALRIDKHGLLGHFLFKAVRQFPVLTHSLLWNLLSEENPKVSQRIEQEIAESAKREGTARGKAGNHAKPKTVLPSIPAELRQFVMPPTPESHEFWKNKQPTFMQVTFSQGTLKKWLTSSCYSYRSSSTVDETAHSRKPFAKTAQTSKELPVSKKAGSGPASAIPPPHGASADEYTRAGAPLAPQATEGLSVPQSNVAVANLPPTGQHDIPPPHKQGTRASQMTVSRSVPDSNSMMNLQPGSFFTPSTSYAPVSQESIDPRVIEHIQQHPVSTAPRPQLAPEPTNPFTESRSVHILEWYPPSKFSLERPSKYKSKCGFICITKEPLALHGFQNELSFEDPLPNLTASLRLAVMDSLTPVDLAYWKAQRGFWEPIIGISGRMREEVLGKKPTTRKKALRTFLQDLKKQAEREYLTAFERIERILQKIAEKHVLPPTYSIYPQPLQGLTQNPLLQHVTGLNLGQEKSKPRVTNLGSTFAGRSEFSGPMPPTSSIYEKRSVNLPNYDNSVASSGQWLRPTATNVSTVRENGTPQRKLNRAALSERARKVTLQDEIDASQPSIQVIYPLDVLVCMAFTSGNSLGMQITLTLLDSKVKKGTKEGGSSVQPKRDLPLAGAIGILGGVFMRIDSDKKATVDSKLHPQLSTIATRQVSFMPSRQVSADASAYERPFPTHPATHMSSPQSFVQRLPSLPSVTSHKVTSRGEKVDSSSGDRERAMKTLLLAHNFDCLTPVDEVYIPNDPELRVVRLKMDSGRVMQSASKCPFLLELQCEKMDISIPVLQRYIARNWKGPLSETLRTSAVPAFPLRHGTGQQPSVSFEQGEASRKVLNVSSTGVDHDQLADAYSAANEGAAPNIVDIQSERGKLKRALRKVKLKSHWLAYALRQKLAKQRVLVSKTLSKNVLRSDEISNLEGAKSTAKLQPMTLMRTEEAKDRRGMSTAGLSATSQVLDVYPLEFMSHQERSNVESAQLEQLIRKAPNEPILWQRGKIPDDKDSEIVALQADIMQTKIRDNRLRTATTMGSHTTLYEDRPDGEKGRSLTLDRLLPQYLDKFRPLSLRAVPFGRQISYTGQDERFLHDSASMPQLNGSSVNADANAVAYLQRADSKRGARKPAYESRAGQLGQDEDTAGQGNVQADVLSAPESIRRRSSLRRGEFRYIAPPPVPPKALVHRSLIFKAYDDCRQDALAIQVLRFLSAAYSESRIPLPSYPYSVIPMRIGTNGNPGGILEVIPGVRSRDEIGKSGFRSLLKYYIHKFGPVTNDNFQVARQNFMLSATSAGIHAYILWVKDRHNGNLLHDEQGNIWPIDFGFLLGISPGGNLGFERAMFKVTQEMVDILSNTEICGEGRNTSLGYSEFCQFVARGILVARDHGFEIQALINSLADSGLPCFYFPWTLNAMWKRLRMDDYDTRVADWIVRETRLAANAVTTVLYDGVQKLQNKISSEAWG